MADPLQNPSLYQPLHEPSSIRLLKLSPSSSRDPETAEVKGELKTFCLSEPDCPPFTTVSYTWGDINTYSDEPIRLGNHETRVLESVLPLLRMLCSNPSGDFDLENGWFWVDSICIDQGDAAERASQVKLMGHIYSRARATVVWLAEGTEDSHRAIDFLSELAGRRQDLRRGVRRAGKRLPPDLLDHPGWKHLERLLSLPWWRRVWTLQEFILARDLRFYCGTKFISCSGFRKGMHSVELCRPFETHIESRVWHTAWNRRRLIQWYEHDHSRDNMSLVSLLAFCGDYQATDPRDRVWAVYGLVCDYDRQMIGHPTYGNDVETLYTDLVKAYVEKYKSLDIIGYAQMFRSSDPGWPSWVPDWRVEARPLVVPLMVSQSAKETLDNFRPDHSRHRHTEREVRAKVLFKAGGDRPQIPDFWDTPGYLTCRGVLVDYIDGLGNRHDIEGARVIESTSPFNTMAVNPQEEVSLMESVARSLTLNRQDQYLEYSAPVRRYSRELQQLAAACQNKDGVCEPAPQWFESWWAVNSTLRVRGLTLRDIFYTEDLDRKVQLAKNPLPRAKKSFFLRMRGVMKEMFRRFMVTDEGHIGAAPKTARKGDLVCVLFGCSVPVVLRKRGQCDDGESVYELIGECYLDQFMDGEALSPGRQTQDFKIQ